MTAIAQALAQGYGGEEIIKYLKRAFPKMAPSIAKATANGYGADQILKYVSRLLEDEKPTKGLSPHEIEKGNQERTNKLGKQILGSAATGLGLSAFAKNVPNIIKGAQQAIGTPSLQLPNSGTSVGSNIGPKPMAGAPITPPPINASSPVAPGTPIQPQAVQPVQPPQQNAPNVDSSQIIADMGIGSQVKNLAEAGNDPEAIATAVGISLKPNQKKWLEEQIKAGTAKSLPEMISDFLSNPSSNEKKSPEIAENMQKQAQNSKVERINTENGGYYEGPNFEQTGTAKKLKKIEEEKPIEKGSIVATPSGESGTIKSLRNKEALIDEDGKLHKVKKEDLVQIPENIRNQNFEEILDKYFHQFPEEGEGSLSDNLSGASYSPGHGIFPSQTLVSFIDSPHKIYLYENVEPELFDTISEGTGTTKTSGGTGLPGKYRVGLFDSRGGPFQKVRENPEKYPFTVFNVEYSMFGDLAQTLKQRRLRKKREDREKQKRNKSS